MTEDGYTVPIPEGPYVEVHADPIKQLNYEVESGQRSQGAAFSAAMDLYEEPIKQSMVIAGGAELQQRAVVMTGGSGLLAVPGVSTGTAMFGSSVIGGATVSGGSAYATAKIYGASTGRAIEEGRAAMGPGAVAGGIGFGFGATVSSGSRLAVAGGAMTADVGAQGTMIAFGLRDGIDPTQVLISGTLAAATTPTPPMAGGFEAPRIPREVVIPNPGDPTFIGPGGPYSHLQDPPGVGPGLLVTAAQRRAIAQDNLLRNQGQLRSDSTVDPHSALVPGQKSQRGVTPLPNEAQIDHIQPVTPADPNAPPGWNSFKNLRIISREMNRAKSNQ